MDAMCCFVSRAQHITPVLKVINMVSTEYSSHISNCTNVLSQPPTLTALSTKKKVGSSRATPAGGDNVGEAVLADPYLTKLHALKERYGKCTIHPGHQRWCVPITEGEKIGKCLGIDLSEITFWAKEWVCFLDTWQHQRL